jgi:hypothetical protein
MCKKLETNMTRRITASVCLAALLSLSGIACKGKHNNLAAVQNEEPDRGPQLISNVRMNDTSAGVQLLSGFYPVESGAWRWTAGKFSVLLKTPPGAAQSGATLSFAFAVPDAVIEKLKTVKLTASVDGMPLKSEEYSKAGAQVFGADLPASMLTPDSIKFDFALDKSIPPGVDKRELGVVATSVGLIPK